MSEIKEKVKEEESKPEVMERIELSPIQKGLISLGVVSGLIYALKQKKGFWGMVGYAWLGSMAGGGIGYLVKAAKKKG